MTPSPMSDRQFWIILAALIAGAVSGVCFIVSATWVWELLGRGG
jgi:hypothetical protein